MDCPACGASNDDAARFCSSCGQPMGALAEERRVVTVLFADLVGFTSLSEHRDPESVKRVVDGAFERLVRDVTAFGGRVDKIVGDAIVALFGAPVAHEDDPERAVRAALRMQETLGTYGSETGIDIRMRVGVNTGEVLVGALRAGGDYTAMGDVVNLASRLQTAASPGEVVVGEATHGATVDAISYESRGHLTARGREQSEPVWAATAALRLPGPTRRTASTPLVGRDTELAMLLNAARASIHHGRAQMVILMGEAGVGKSRLASELAATLSVHDAVEIHEGRCLPYGEVNPWWPIAELVRTSLGLAVDASAGEALDAVRAVVLDVVGTDASQGEEVTNGLLHMLGYDGPLRGVDGSAARSEAIRSVVTFVEGHLRRSALFIRISDLHWADDAVFELLDELVVRLARQPLVLVATARRALQSRWSPRSGRFNSIVLNLDPLDRTAVHQLLGQLTDEHLDAASTELLLDRSGGNPFYLEELVTLMGPREGAGVSASGAQLPETLRGLVAARIDALTAEEQDVLGDAAVWGPSGVVMVLDRIAEAARGVPTVADVVQSLGEKDVLVVDGKRWSFRSDLVREVTYARLTKADRLRGHAGIASYLDDLVDGTDVDDSMVETITRHVTEAAVLAADVGGDHRREQLRDRALHWLREGADRTERRGAWPSAVRLHSRVLDLCGDDDELRARSLLGRSRAFAEQWDNEAALRDGEAGLVLAEELGSAPLRTEALLRLAAAHMRRGDWVETDRLLDEALAMHKGSGHTAGRGEVLRQQGLSRLLRGDYRSAEAPILAALECFWEENDRRGEGWAYQSLAWIAFGDNRIDRATEYVEASEAAFRDAGDRGGVLWTSGLAAFVDLARGQFDEARDHAQRVLTESDRRGDRFAMGMMHIVLGGAELWTGHPGAAVTSAEHALSHLDERTDFVGTELALTLLGRALVMTGAVTRGLATLRKAMDASGRTSTDFAQSVAPLTEAQLGLPGALTDLDSVDSSPQAATATTALLLLQSGRREEAAGVLGRTTADLPSDRASAAVVAAALGDRELALTLTDGVDAIPGATYHDAAMVAVVRALLDLGPQGDDVVARARAALGPTGDRVMGALVDLADSIRGERGAPGAAAEASAVAREMDALGLGTTAWRDVFVAIASPEREQLPTAGVGEGS